MQDLNQKARTEGWELGEVVDSGKRNLHWRIFGLSMTNVEALQFVMGRARERSSLHLQALRMVAQGSTSKARR